MKISSCPKCNETQIVKSGIIKDRQRYLCKKCNYYFTVNKIEKNGKIKDRQIYLCKKSNYYFTVNKIKKKIDNYYITKALQLYLEGLSYREIERIIGVSHVTVSNLVKEFKVKKPSHNDNHPTYKIFNHAELVEYLKNKEQLSGAGMVITELGDKFMLIKWERFRD